MIATMPGNDLFRTAPLRGMPTESRVDREKMSIFGAKAMQIGPLNAGDARPWKVDATTLGQLETLVNQRNTGSKVRFAHPNASQDGMGRHLGRASNARRVSSPDGDYTAVDLRLSTAATSSPRGNLAAHVLDLADETPEDFGLSIAPLLDHEAMSKIEPDENGLVPIRLKGLRAIDVVDEPAATRGGMFDLQSSDLADLPARATDLLDTFFAESPAEVIRARFGAFLETYLNNRGDNAMTTTVVQPIEQPKEPPVAPVAQPLAVDDAAKQAARAELARVAELEAICKLAGIPDDKKALMVAAGFNRQDAQDWIKASGLLAIQNPPIGEGGNDPAPKAPTPEEKYAAEFDATPDVFAAQGLSKEQYIKSRLRG